MLTNASGRRLQTARDANSSSCNATSASSGLSHSDRQKQVDYGAVPSKAQRAASSHNMQSDSESNRVSFAPTSNPSTSIETEVGDEMTSPDEQSIDQTMLEIFGSSGEEDEGKVEMEDGDEDNGEDSVQNEEQAHSNFDLAKIESDFIKATADGATSASAWFEEEESSSFECTILYLIVCSGNRSAGASDPVTQKASGTDGEALYCLQGLEREKQNFDRSSSHMAYLNSGANQLRRLRAENHPERKSRPRQASQKEGPKGVSTELVGKRASHVSGKDAHSRVSREKTSQLLDRPVKKPKLDTESMPLSSSGQTMPPTSKPTATISPAPKPASTISRTSKPAVMPLLAPPPNLQSLLAPPPSLQPLLAPAPKPAATVSHVPRPAATISANQFYSKSSADRHTTTTPAREEVKERNNVRHHSHSSSDSSSGKRSSDDPSGKSVDLSWSQQQVSMAAEMAELFGTSDSEQEEVWEQPEGSFETALTSVDLTLKSRARQGERHLSEARDARNSLAASHPSRPLR
eukprot:Em0011g1064a